MADTGGKMIRSKLYIGFGVSGASHHVCGGKDSGAPARIICGMPLSVPYPSSIRRTIRSAATAGETAPSTAP